jgi:fused signal recognition particle receptor
MNELGKIRRIVNPDITLLTIDALAGNDAVMQAEEFHGRVGIDGTILTKVDADQKGGAALSVTYVTQKPILFIGIGQEYDDLQHFDPQQFTQMILN